MHLRMQATSVGNPATNRLIIKNPGLLKPGFFIYRNSSSYSINTKTSF